MPPEISISMRHTKLKAEEAALLTGELKKPSWESRNEGIHERVSFEDAIWGFDLAGGAYYKTPLRVTAVKPNSRAEKAGVRPGDKLLRINDIDTSTLTIQEAHEIIVQSGIHLKIAVTAPEDDEDSYFCYEDPLMDGYDSEEERLMEEEKARRREVHAKVSSYWSLQWPWVSKRRVIYRESNCFMVPSKFETKHKEHFPERPFLRKEEDIVLHSSQNKKNYRSRNLTMHSNVNSSNIPNLNGNGNLEDTNADITSSQLNGLKDEILTSNEYVENKSEYEEKPLSHRNGNLENIPEIEENSSTEEPSSSMIEDEIETSVSSVEILNSEEDTSKDHFKEENDSGPPDQFTNGVLNESEENVKDVLENER